METVLQTYNLEIGYRVGGEKKSVAAGINISLYKGELVCLLGANGKGKSTLLRTLAGNQPALAGEVKINGQEIGSVSKRKLAKLMSLVYTDHTQAGGLTVRELVELGRQPHTGFLGRLDAEDKAIVEKALADAGIAHKANDFVAELSDGERQKAMIARALAQETPIIFLDEPTAFLDVASKIETMRLLHRLARENNKAILLSSHDVSQALRLADRLITIDAAGKLNCGVTEQMVVSGELAQLFDASRIRFEAQEGNFYACEKYRAKASVESGSETVKMWIKNALRRNLFELVESEAEIKIKETPEGGFEMIVNNGTAEKFSCIGELSERLNNLQIK